MNEPIQSNSGLSRRHFIGATAAISAGIMTFPGKIFSNMTADSETLRYPLGICDVYILKRTSLGAVQRAKEIGVQGLEPDIGALSDKETFIHDPNKTLLDIIQRNAFIAEAKRIGIQFTSLGMVSFLGQDFGSRTTVLTKMIPDAIDTMKAMGIKIAYLPLRAKCLVKFPETRPRIVERLKATALLAEKENLIFGIETTYPGVDEVKLIDEIGSPSIRSYFNFKNPVEEGRDLIQELKIFGRERICQIHCTEEDGSLLRNNKKINYQKVYETLNEMNYSGWLVMERGRVSGMDTTKGYQDNAEYLKSVFQGANVPQVNTYMPVTRKSTYENISLQATNGMLYIRTPKHDELETNVSIYDFQGKSVGTWSYTKLHCTAPVKLKPHLVGGNYLVCVNIGGYNYSQNIVWRQ